MKLVFGLTALTLAMVACGRPDEPRAGGDGAPTPAAEVRDSAGVRIVENVRPPVGSRLEWTVGSEPAVSIGALEGADPYLLDGVRDLLTLPDGRIVVANRGSHELRVFDAAGSHLATWGGEGEGPGEFNSLVQVERWPGDSVVAWYSQDRRLSVFDAEGNFGRTLKLESDRPISADAVFPSGAILVSQSVPGGSAADGSSREQRRYEVRVAEGEQPASLGSFFGSERYTSSLGATMFLMTVPFAHRIVNFAWGELAVVASNDSYEVRAYGADGSLVRIVRIDHDLIPVTSAHRDAFVERQAVAPEPSGVTAETTRQLRDFYRDVPLPETHPAFVTAMADALDHLWVQEYNLPGEGGANPLWTVLDPEGRVLGFVETPAGLRVYEIGEDYILGRSTDDLGVEYAQVWPLSRSGG